MNAKQSIKFSRKFSSKAASIEHAKLNFKLADAVCFDVDSTMIQEEALDALGEFKGVGKQVAELSNK